MRLQEGDEFLLKGNLAVVLLLVANILHQRGYVGLADAEGAVPRLSSEGRPMRSLVDPQGRVRFDEPQRFRHREPRGKRQETVNMLGPGVRVNQLTVDIPDDPSHTSEQVRAEVGCEEWLAVLGGKDDMGEQVGKGVSHRLSPFGAGTMLTQIFVPHGSRRGLFSIGPPGLRCHLPGPSNVETPGGGRAPVRFPLKSRNSQKPTQNKQRRSSRLSIQ